MSYANCEIVVREIHERDLGIDFCTTLSNLADVGELILDKNLILELYFAIKKKSNSKIFVAILENKIVGSITTIIEQKFIHNGGKVCHIEDVVTRKGYEKMGIGSLLVKKAIEFAILENCYKVILSCSEQNFSFYQKNGFYKHEITMRLDIDKI
ncbi:MAG: GNAT family N-acetyltransferase [Nitrososphaeraceae archaeon]|nr:GNAT family N-acetyltransferase [Nitrososphaeraceae archaeon]